MKIEFAETDGFVYYIADIQHNGVQLDYEVLNVLSWDGGGNVDETETYFKGEVKWDETFRIDTPVEIYEFDRIDKFYFILKTIADYSRKYFERQENEN